MVDDDMKEEATKLLTEENELVVEFFNKPETIMTILKYIHFILTTINFELVCYFYILLFVFDFFRHISTVQSEPDKLNDDQLEDIMGRIEFAKEAISSFLSLPLRPLIITYVIPNFFYKLIHYWRYPLTVAQFVTAREPSVFG